MADDPVARTLQMWHPDFGDLPQPDEDSRDEDYEPYSPGERKGERPGHVGLQRRGHAGHRR